MHLANLEQEGARKDKDEGSNDPNRINGVIEEFMVHLARAIKDAKQRRSAAITVVAQNIFTCNCPLMKTLKKTAVKWQGGDGIKEGSLDPSNNSYHTKEPPERGFQSIKPPQQTPFLNPNPFQCWHGVQNIDRVRINRDSCMVLLDNGRKINPIMPKYISDHSLQMGLITDLLGAKVNCVGLGNAYIRPLGYIVIQVQVDRVQGYDEDQIALVILDLSNFVARIPFILGTPTISCIVNVLKEKEIDALGKCQGSSSLIGVKNGSHQGG